MDLDKRVMKGQSSSRTLCVFPSLQYRHRPQLINPQGGCVMCHTVRLRPPLMASCRSAEAAAAAAAAAALTGLLLSN